MTVRFYIFVSIFTHLLFSQQASARFNHEDANEIDSDFNFNTETYNDILSYRWPMRWLQLWDGSQSGYRVSAGSLTMTRFYFAEDVKIDPIPLEDFSIAFEQHRLEDYAEATEQREVRLGVRVTPWLRILLLGDGSVLKEYGDIGVGLRLLEGASEFTDLYVWSIDHYYNDKTHEEYARRDNDIRTYGVRSRRTVTSERIGWNFVSEMDSPVVWSRPNRGVYRYQRTSAAGRIEAPVSTSETLFLGLSRDAKRESWSSTRQEFGVGLTRDVLTTEVGTNITRDAVDWEMSVLYVSRRTTWDKAGDVKSYRDWIQDVPPDFSEREEGGLIFKRTHKVWQATLFTQGLVCNQVVLSESEQSWRELEVKYITALNWNFTQKAGFGLNATWDVDQVTRDFPYRRSSFRPWGGGNIQAQMVF